MNQIKRSIFYFVALFSLLFISFALYPKCAMAINTGTVGILPAYPDPNNRETISWFIYKLDLGQSKEDAVRIINNHDETAIIKLYAVDATITTDGAFALLPEDADRKDVGGWVKLALNEIEVPAKSEKIVPFTITIPKDADVGDHAGGIVMQEIEGKDQTVAGTGVKIITRVGVRIYETIPGEVRKGFEISRYDWQPAVNEKANFFQKLIGLDKKTHFFLGIRNKGNIKISPKVKVEIKDMFGRTVGNINETEMGVVFPKTETKDAMLTWNGMPIIGRYTSRLTVNFPQDLGEGSQELVMWAFPFRLAIELIFLFVIIILIRLILQYVREVKKEAMPVYTTQAGDTIIQLANNFSVKWKKIAKINEIKKPFEIKAGDKLFVPFNKANVEQFKQMHQLGRIESPINETSSSSKKSKQKIVKIIIIAAVIVLAAIFYYLKHRTPSQPPMKQSEQQSAPADQPTENSQKTSGGVIKRSGINVEICTPSGMDQESSKRLQEKLMLIGYQAIISPSACQGNYDNTTIEYGQDSKDQADTVKNDIGTKETIDVAEVSGIKGIIVYNKLSKDDFLQIDQNSKAVSAARELIKISVFDAGAAEGKAEEIRKILYDAGYGVTDEVTKSETAARGIAVEYAASGQKDNATSVKNFLAENKYSAAVKQSGSSGDSLALTVGK